MGLHNGVTRVPGVGHCSSRRTPFICKQAMRLSVRKHVCRCLIGLLAWLCALACCCLQPFEDVLPYPDFSVRLSLHQLPRLVPLLRAIPPVDVARMQQALARVHKAFIWQREVGGQAYNYTLASLRKRMIMLQGHLVLAPAPGTVRKGGTARLSRH